MLCLEGAISAALASSQVDKVGVRVRVCIYIHIYGYVCIYLERAISAALAASQADEVDVCKHAYSMYVSAIFQY
jgi:hypothetical protein